MATSSLYAIEKLDVSNYETWTVQMRSVLIHGGLWKVVTEVKPTNADELALWTVSDEKALATIILSVKSNQLSYIKNCKSSAEAWLKLKEVYKPQGPIQKVSLYKQLLSKRMQDEENPQEFINAFTEIADKLSETGINIQDDLLSIILLSSLPKSFDNFVIAMETRDSLPCFSALKIKLIEEGERRKRQNEPAEFEQHDKKTQNKSKFKCFACGKRGHFANKCKEKEKRNSRETAMNVIAMTNMQSKFDDTC
ncbi:PREDICTED: uncharacterized protein LOC108366072 [Rhagoletis zephyria]|uniref:uncharacterized protein LOC108366072 n=1 Tax=Rhagoletis zephyria TaxID=28612 RepID=UPI0008119E51|nr:PREDICTED: uncharacterized protein LOC108366072 [Rhagoletis zephyria]